MSASSPHGSVEAGGVNGVTVQYKITTDQKPILIIKGVEYEVTDLTFWSLKIKSGTTKELLESIAQIVAESLVSQGNLLEGETSVRFSVDQDPAKEDASEPDVPAPSRKVHVKKGSEAAAVTVDLGEGSTAVEIFQETFVSTLGTAEIEGRTNFDIDLSQEQYLDAVGRKPKSKIYQEGDKTYGKGQLEVLPSLVNSLRISQHVLKKGKSKEADFKEHMEFEEKEARASVRSPDDSRGITRHNFVTPEQEKAFAQKNIAGIQEHFTGKKTGLADQRTNADPKYFRRMVDITKDFDEACELAPGGTPINLTKQSAIAGDDPDNPIDKVSFLRAGEVSDLRNGWFSLDFMDQVYSAQELYGEKSREKLILAKSEQILTFIKGKPLKLDIPKEAFIDGVIRELTLRERLQEAIEQVEDELALALHAPLSEDNPLSRRLQLQSCRRGLLALQQLLPREKSKKSDKAQAQAEDAQSEIENDRVIEAAIMERQVALDNQMLQLVVEAVKNSPNAFININGKVYFNLTYQGLVCCYKSIQMGKGDLDKSGWMHDESVVMEDCYAMFARFNGANIVFDQEDVPLIQRGKSKNTLHLPKAIAPPNIEMPKAGCELRALFFNIVPQGKNDAEIAHIGAQKQIDDAAIEYINSWIEEIGKVEVPQKALEASDPKALQEAQNVLGEARQKMDNKRAGALHPGGKDKEEWLAQLELVEKQRTIVVGILKKALKKIQQDIAEADAESPDLPGLLERENQLKLYLLKEDLMLLKNIIDETAIRGEGSYDITQKIVNLGILSLIMGCMSAKDRTGLVSEKMVISMISNASKPQSKGFSFRVALADAAETRRLEKALGSPFSPDTPSAQHGARTEGSTALKAYDKSLDGVKHLWDQLKREKEKGWNKTSQKAALAARAEALKSRVTVESEVKEAAEDAAVSAVVSDIERRAGEISQSKNLERPGEVVEARYQLALLRGKERTEQRAKLFSAVSKKVRLIRKELREVSKRKPPDPGLMTRLQRSLETHIGFMEGLRPQSAEIRTQLEKMQSLRKDLEKESVTQEKIADFRNLLQSLSGVMSLLEWPHDKSGNPLPPRDVSIDAFNELAQIIYETYDLLQAKLPSHYSEILQCLSDFLNAGSPYAALIKKEVIGFLGANEGRVLVPSKKISFTYEGERAAEILTRDVSRKEKVIQGALKREEGSIKWEIFGKKIRKGEEGVSIEEGATLKAVSDQLSTQLDPTAVKKIMTFCVVDVFGPYQETVMIGMKVPCPQPKLGVAADPLPIKISLVGGFIHIEEQLPFNIHQAGEGGEQRVIGECTIARKCIIPVASLSKENMSLDALPGIKLEVEITTKPLPPAVAVAS